MYAGSGNRDLARSWVTERVVSTEGRLWKGSRPFSAVRGVANLVQTHESLQSVPEPVACIE